MSSYLINIYRKIKHFIYSTDIVFLIFLMLITNVSLAIKAFAVIFIYIARFNFKFDLKNKRISIFYPLMIGLIFIQSIINFKQLNGNYLIIVGLGIGFWAASFLISHQTKLAIEKSGTEKLKRTIATFFTINIFISIGSIINIMLITQNMNPYTYTGMDLNYHMSTGDHIRGIFQDLSTTNCCINILGVIYFLISRKYSLAIFCLIVVLLTTSNINTIILLLVFLAIFAFYASKLLKTIVVCFVGIILLFFIKITPENIRYLAKKVGVDYEIKSAEPFFALSEIDKNLAVSKRDSAIIHTEKNVFNRLYQEKKNLAERNKLKEAKFEAKFEQEHAESLNHFAVFANKHYGVHLKWDSNQIAKPYSGKLLSFVETKQYLSAGPSELILGAGIGNFSSKLAFKASGIQIFGRYPERLSYINDNFKANHLKTLSYYMIQPPGKHSTSNMPFSTYNQLLGEYGLIGFVLFIGFYVFYFLRKWKFLTYGKILLPVLLLFFVTDYWFEHLSIVIIFELLMYLDIVQQEQKEKNVTKITQ